MTGNSQNQSVEIAIIGAGIAGIAAAYYLCVENRKRSVLLIDSRQAMSYTSAQSGDNYRNWWPHSTMAAFTDDSIDELDRLARETDNVFHMTQGGYAVATRRPDVSDIVAAIPGDIDVRLIDKGLASRYPALAPTIRNVIQIGRAGDISGQQLGQWMLEKFRAAGGRKMRGEVTGIARNPAYQLDCTGPDGVVMVNADIVVNAAGPFVNKVAAMLDITLPVKNTFQQKIAFEDTFNAVPRDMPFSIDMDRKTLGWSDDEQALLRADSEHEWLAEEFPGGTHCRPEGGATGKWVKLGWAYNKAQSEPEDDLANEPAIDAHFPEVVIRGAAALIPSLVPYIESPPRRFSHYGGYYTATDENWPLIGPLDGDGAFVVGALSGFGSMAACAAGKLCAAHIGATALPQYAANLSPARYNNQSLMAVLGELATTGSL